MLRNIFRRTVIILTIISLISPVIVAEEVVATSIPIKWQSGTEAGKVRDVVVNPNKAVTMPTGTLQESINFGYNLQKTAGTDSVVTGIKVRLRVTNKNTTNDERYSYNYSPYLRLYFYDKNDVQQVVGTLGVPEDSHKLREITQDTYFDLRSGSYNALLADKIDRVRIDRGSSTSWVDYNSSRGTVITLTLLEVRYVEFKWYWGTR